MQTCNRSLGNLPRVAKLGARAPLHSLHASCRRYASGLSKQVAVLGGGITGLATAYFIRQQAPHVGVTLYETKEELGGWLKSTRIPYEDGSVLFEAGPRSLRPNNNGVLAARLINELGLKDQTIITSKRSAAATSRYLYYPDHLVRMPHPALGLWENIKTVLTEPVMKGAFSAVLKDMSADPRDESIKDESITDFFTRRFNAQIVDQLVSGIIHGIYAGNVDHLSARSIFPRPWSFDTSGLGVLWGGLQSSQVGLLVRASEVTFLKEMRSYQNKWDKDLRADLAASSVFAFKDGMSTLTDAMARRLWEDADVDVRISSKVDSLEYLPESKKVKVRHASSNDQVFDNVVSTLSAAHLSHLMPDVKLPKISSVNVMTVNLFYDTTEFLPPGPTPDKLGFGYLIPRGVPFEQNPERALGVVFDHAYAPLERSDLPPGYRVTQDVLPRGGTKLTVMLGGHWWDNWPSFPEEEEGLAMARSVVARHLGITKEPTLWRVNMQQDCIPQYTVGHEDRLQEIHQSLQNSYHGTLRVAGNWMSGVGVNDCLRSAWDVSRSLLDGKESTGLDIIGKDEWVRMKVSIEG